MNDQTKPFVVAYCEYSDESANFILPGKEVSIPNYNDLIAAILSECDGYSTIEKIIESVKEETEFSSDEIKEMVSVLLNQGVIIDSCKIYQSFHSVSSNPMYFGRDTELAIIKHLL